jgi:hypothetical protein
MAPAISVPTKVRRFREFSFIVIVERGRHPGPKATARGVPEAGVALRMTPRGDPRPEAAIKRKPPTSQSAALVGQAFARCGYFFFAAAIRSSSSSEMTKLPTFS